MKHIVQTFKWMLHCSGHCSAFFCTTSELLFPESMINIQAQLLHSCLCDMNRQSFTIWLTFSNEKKKTFNGITCLHSAKKVVNKVADICD